MSLPVSLAKIFKQKQRTYKMVLVLAMLDEMSESRRRVLFPYPDEQAFREHRFFTGNLLQMGF